MLAARSYRLSAKMLPWLALVLCLGVCAPIVKADDAPAAPATSTTDGALYVTSGNMLYTIQPTSETDGTVTQTPITGIQDIGPIAYDCHHGKLIMYDTVQKHIVSYDPETAQLEVVLDHGINNLTDMAYDHLAGNLYWTDGESGTIEMISLDTHRRHAIIHQREVGNNEIPVAIALVPEKNYIFVALAGENKVDVGRLPMNGLALIGKEGRKRYTDLDLHGLPCSLNTDHDLKQLVWSDALKIGNLTAKDGEIKSKTLDRPASDMTIYHDKYSWVDRDTNKIRWVKKGEVGSPSLEKDVGIAPGALHPHILGVPHKREPNAHPCRENNGNCAHLCIAVGESNAVGDIGIPADCELP